MNRTGNALVFVPLILLGIAALACGAALPAVPAIMTAMPTAARPTVLVYPTLPPEWTVMPVAFVQPTYTPLPTYTPYPTLAAPTQTPYPTQAPPTSRPLPTQVAPRPQTSSLDSVLLDNGFDRSPSSDSQCTNMVCRVYMNSANGIVAQVYPDNGGLMLGVMLNAGYSSAMQGRTLAFVITQGYGLTAGQETVRLMSAFSEDPFGGAQSGAADNCNIQISINNAGDLIMIGIIPFSVQGQQG